MNDKVSLRKKYTDASIADRQAGSMISEAENIISKRNPDIIGIYLALASEADISSLLIRFPDAKFAAPKIENDRISFVRYYLTSPLQKNNEYSQFSEPKSDEIVYPDLIFVPSVALDLRGYRLGRGKGHYDKYFADNDAYKVGISTNLLEYIPDEPHDKKMDAVISENMVINICR